MRRPVGWVAPILSAALVLASAPAAAASPLPGDEPSGLSESKQAARRGRPRSTPGYPATAIVGAFLNTCSRLQSFQSAHQQAARTGWSPLANVANTPLAHIASSARVDGRRGRVEYFQQRVEGENLYLMLTQGNAGGRPLITCRVIDINETRRIMPGEVSALIGRRPNEATGEAEPISGAYWQPGLTTQQLRLVLRNVPPGGSPEFSGVMLEAVQRNPRE